MNKFLLVLLLAGALVSAGHAADQSSPMPPPKIKVGDMAPGLYAGGSERPQSLAARVPGRKNVALAFYIFAFTGG